MKKILSLLLLTLSMANSEISLESKQIKIIEKLSNNQIVLQEVRNAREKRETREKRVIEPIEKKELITLTRSHREMRHNRMEKQMLREDRQIHYVHVLPSKHFASLK